MLTLSNGRVFRHVSDKPVAVSLVEGAEGISKFVPLSPNVAVYTFADVKDLTHIGAKVKGTFTRSLPARRTSTSSSVITCLSGGSTSPAIGFSPSPGRRTSCRPGAGFRQTGRDAGRAPQARPGNRGGSSATITLEALDELLKSPEVASVELDREVQLTSTSRLPRLGPPRPGGSPTLRAVP